MSKMMKRMMIIFLVIIMVTGTVVTANASNMANFTDVQEHWGYDAIGWVVDNGYMVGVSSTQFNPDGTVTRAQITQILYNMAGKPDVTGWTNPYKDVSEESWYKNAAVWAYKKGLTGNNLCTYFGPDECVPREQIALMFELYALNIDTANKKAKFELDDKYMSKFEDLSAIGNDVFYKALNWAVQYGIIQGVSKTEIAPEAYTTRAMMAQLIKNYYDHRDEGGGDPPPVSTDPPAESRNPEPTPTPDLGEPGDGDKPKPGEVETPEPTPTPDLGEPGEGDKPKPGEVESTEPTPTPDLGEPGEGDKPKPGGIE